MDQTTDRTAAAIASPAPKAAHWAVLGVLVIIWGSAFAANRIGVETIPAPWLVAGRLVVGAVFLGAWILGERGLRGARAASERVSMRAILWYGAIGVFFTALPFTFYATAAKTSSSAVLAICNGGTPFFTALLAHWLVPSERLTLRRTLGTVLGFAGLTVLVWPQLMQGVNAQAVGLILAVVGAGLYAGSNVGTRLGPKLSPAMSSLIIVAAGAVTMLVVAPFMAPWPASATIPSVVAMVFLGLMPTGFSFILYVWLVRGAGSLFTSFTTYLSPLWAAAVGVVLFGERIEVTMISAMALIFAGVAIANRMPSFRLSARPTR